MMSSFIWACKKNTLNACKQSSNASGSTDWNSSLQSVSFSKKRLSTWGTVSCQKACGQAGITWKPLPNILKPRCIPPSRVLSDSLDTIDASLRTLPRLKIPCMSMQEVTQLRKEGTSSPEQSGQECILPAKEGCDMCSSPSLSTPSQRILAWNGCLKAGTGGCVVQETIQWEVPSSCLQEQGTTQCGGQLP